ncbi:MAG: hypothetical protein CR974_00980 [Gammaproteobacteria bacterium]|nr:MAG: hypothetical protein CR974_00980 [Gammaproteobacteria bacterium]
MLPLFYINLNSRTDRNNLMQQQLDKLSLNAERLSAVNGKQLTPSEKAFVDERKFFLRMRRPISAGEIGCAASHRAIWQKMLDNGLDFALVMEDDVEIHPDLLSLMTSASYKDYDLINLSTTAPYSVDFSALQKTLAGEQRLQRHEQNAEKFQRLDWNNNWRIQQLEQIGDSVIIAECTSAPALTSGYILSAKAAENFLARSEQLDVPIDYIWRYAGGRLKQAFSVPSLIVQQQADSDIAGRDVAHQLSLPQKIGRFIVKNQSSPRKRDVKTMYS